MTGLDARRRVASITLPRPTSESLRGVEPIRHSTREFAFDGPASNEFQFLAGVGQGRRIALLAVHHVEVGGVTYTGGAEKYIRTTLKALLASGASVHVGYSGTSIYQDLLDSFSPRQLTVERTNWLDEALSGDARLQWRVIRERRRWLRGSGADTVFVVQQAGGGAFGASIVAAKSLGLRTIMSARQQPEPVPRTPSTTSFAFPPSLGLWRRRLIWRRRIPAYCCDAIIFNSRAVAESYALQYGWPKGRSHVIPNGERTCNLLRGYHGVPRNIAAIGRVTHAKGADTLLEAFALLVTDHPSTKLTYYGDGGLIRFLKDRAETLGLSHRVIFAGYKRWRESIYPYVDVCVQLSRRESMSNSVLEAMAYGVPCVVSDVGGLPETVVDGATGFVVSPDDAPACANAIRRLLEAPDLADRMGRAGAARVRDHFGLDQVMEKTVRRILGAADQAVSGKRLSAQLRSTQDQPVSSP